MVEIDHLWQKHLLATEGQELTGESGGAIARPLDLRQQLAHRMFGPELCKRKLAVSVDGREQIVEIMGYASGKAPDGLHLLGLPELFFQSFEIGDIASDSD